MIRDLGIVKPGTTLYIPFHTFDSNDPSASVTLTGLAVTDIEIYKNGSVTQRASDAGYALLDTDGIDFDTVTGIHGISIDLANNTTAGFYASGGQYWVVIASVTVDAATVNFVLATFRIGYPDAFLNTTIATLSTQTSFTLTSGPAEANALNGCLCVIHDVASAVQLGWGIVQAYAVTTKTVTLAAGVSFTAAATDNISFYPPALIPTTRGTTLDVTTTGAAGIDWGNVENKTTANDLSATDIQLCDTVTTNTDMRGTDSAALASVCTEARLAELDAANLPATTDNIFTDTSTTLDTKLNDIQGATFSSATDSLEAIRDRGDAAWTTGAGGTPPTTLQNTTIATLASQTSFTLTAGSADNNAYNGCLAIIEDVATATQKAIGIISNYVGATKTVTLREDPAVFVMAATDTIDIVAISPDILKILADTNELQTDWADAGRLDAILDSRMAEASINTTGGAVDTVTTVTTTTTNTDMRGTDSAALASVCTEGRLAELDAANIPADVDAILIDTGTTLDGKINTIDTVVDGIQTDLDNATDGLGALKALIDALNNLSAAQVNAEVDTALLDAGLVLQSTTIATLASQTSFTLTAGSADNNAYNRSFIVIEDAATATQKAVGYISGYTGITKTVTLISDPGVFTMAATDKVSILPRSFVDLLAATQTSIDAIETDTGTTLDGKINTIDTNVNSILVDTGTTLDAALAVVDANVDAILVDTGTTLDAALAVVDANVDAILVDTGTTIPGTITTLQSDTDNIQTRLPAVLIGGKMDSDVEAINNSAPAAVNLGKSTLQIISGAAEGTPTTTVIQTDLAEIQDDIYIGRTVIFTSGAAQDEASDITDYTGATGTLTVTALANAPAAADTFIIV